MKGALCVCPFLAAVHTQTVAKLQKADNSRLNLSSETLVFLQSVFWHIGLPVSTNKLFWNSETRCPQGYSLSQNLQKNFSSCVSEKWPFSVGAPAQWKKLCWKTSKWDVWALAETQDWVQQRWASFVHCRGWLTLAPSPAPPHMPDMTAPLTAPPPPPPAPVREHVSPRPTSKQDKTGWNWESQTVTCKWQWAHSVQKNPQTQTAGTLHTNTHQEASDVKKDKWKVQIWKHA